MISKSGTVLFIIFLCFGSISAQVQREEEDSSGILNPKTISLAVVSGIYVATMIDSYITWWKDDQQPFTFMNSKWFDEPGEYGIDKMGHFYTSYFFFKFQKGIFLLGGYSDVTADILSGCLTLGMALIIEIGDGYSRYGFDAKDLISNISGLTYAWLQEKIPVLNNFNFKWSYFPPNGGWQFPPKFSSHYDGHIYWLSCNIAGLFPASTKVWPAFLNPAVGYSVGSGGTRREFMVGLDLDLYYFLKSENKYIDFAGKTLNLFHIPMPGIKFYEDGPAEFKLLLLN